MELRIVRRKANIPCIWRDDGTVTAVRVELKEVLQYRDGVTHDCPWLDVPIVDEEDTEDE